MSIASSNSQNEKQLSTEIAQWPLKNDWKVIENDFKMIEKMIANDQNAIITTMMGKIASRLWGIEANKATK